MSMRCFPLFLTVVLVLMCSLPNTSVQDDIKWGSPTEPKLRLGKGAVKGLQFSPDGTRLAVTTATGVWLYDVQRWQEIGLFAADTGRIANVSFSSDGKTLAGGSDDATVRLWDVETGSLLKIFTGHKGGVSSVSFSPEGRMLVSGGMDETILLWDIETGSLLKTFTEHRGGVSSVS